MRYILGGILALFILPIFLGEGELFADWSGETRTIFTGAEIGGYNPSSYYDRGAHYRQELDLGLKTDLKDIKLDSFLSVRFTDDKYIDTETSGLEQFYIKFIGDDFGLTMGDFYSRFSNYTLNQSLKGISLCKDITTFEGAKLTALFGTSKPRWEEFYKEIDAEVYTRYVEGFRFEQKMTQETRLGLNFVNSQDDERGSVDSESSNKAIKSRILSLDADTKLLEVLKLNAEFAYSWYNSDVKAEDRGVDKVKTKPDCAGKITSNLKIGDLKLDNAYELVGPSFVSPLGVATTDLEQYSSRLTYKFFPDLETRANFTVLRDNIGKQKSYTTTTYVPLIEFFIRPFPDSLRYLKVESFYQERRRESSDGISIDDNTQTASIGLKNKIKNITYNFGYRLEDKLDDVTSTNERKIHTYLAGASSYFKWGKVRFSPRIQYEIQEDKQMSNKSPDLYQNTSLNTDIYFPGGSALEMGYSLSDSNYKAENKDIVRTIAKLGLRSNLFGDPDKRLNFFYELRDYEKENAGLSYTENLFEARLAFRF